MSAALHDGFRMPLVPPGEKCLQTDKFIFFGPPYLLSLQSAYHPQIEICPSADFKACSVESYLYTTNTVHWQYYQPCCMMYDIIRRKYLLIGRLPMNINH